MEFYNLYRVGVPYLTICHKINTVLLLSQLLSPPSQNIGEYRRMHQHRMNAKVN